MDSGDRRTGKGDLKHDGQACSFIGSLISLPCLIPLRAFPVCTVSRRLHVDNHTGRSSAALQPVTATQGWGMS